MAVIKNKVSNKCWPGCRGMGNFACCWCECKLVQPLKKVWGFLRKLKTELPYDSAIYFWVYSWKKAEMLIQKDMCTSMFIAAFLQFVNIWKHTKCPSTDERIKKMWYTHTHTMKWNTTQPYHKKNEILPFAATWMNLKGVRLSKISHRQRKTNIVWCHLYVEAKNTAN